MNSLYIFYPEGHEAHAEPGHPERPERIESIRQALIANGLWENQTKLAPCLLPQEVLYAVHDPEYIQALQVICKSGVHIDLDTYTTPSSWQVTLNAAGGAIAIASKVFNSNDQSHVKPNGIAQERGFVRGLALTRPPGHHATTNSGMGFCLLNNVALAAEYLLRIDGAQRLAIVDLDLHHGNGTQDIFWRRKDVFFISTHQSPLYPGSGHLDEVGLGEGEGCTANFPLPPGTGDEGFLTILDELIIPLLERYSPEMLLVSVGFDTHWRDPLGHLQLSAGSYGELIRRLATWADRRCRGRIALFLEGGYDLAAGQACASAWVAALLNQPWQDYLGSPAREEGKSWKPVARRAREIWGL